MNLYHIVAAANNRVIGNNNKLPWHISADLKHFQKTTKGSTLLMGRKTFESIGKKALPHRENFVLSRHPGESVENVRYFQSIDEAIKAVPTEKAFVIGGAEIFKQTFKKIDGIVFSRVHADYQGDAFYPEIPEEFNLENTSWLDTEEPRVEVIFYQRRD